MNNITIYTDEDLGQYVRALANANQTSTKRNTSQKKPQSLNKFYITTLNLL